MSRIFSHFRQANFTADEEIPKHLLLIFFYLFIYLRRKSVHICTHTQKKKKKEISTLKDAQLKNTSLKQS